VFPFPSDSKSRQQFKNTGLRRRPGYAEGLFNKNLDFIAAKQAHAHSIAHGTAHAADQKTDAG